MNKNECDTCRNSPNSGIESKSFCSGVIGVFSVDMRTALFKLTQLNISPSFMVKTGKEGQLAKMLPFILEQKEGQGRGLSFSMVSIVHKLGSLGLSADNELIKKAMKMVPGASYYNSSNSFYLANKQE